VIVSEKILVVDDDDIIRSATSRILESVGYQVIQAKNGREAVEQVRAHSPTLVLMDVDMPPGLNGFDTYQQILTDPTHPRVSVIFLSGLRVDVESKLSGFDLGADDYIVRPIPGRELLARVHARLRALKAEQAAREALEQWNTAFDAVSQGIIICDHQFNILRCNYAAGHFFELAPNVIIGHNSQALIFQDEPGAPGSNPSALLETWELFRAGRWLEVHLNSVSPKESASYRHVFVITDISERKQAEAMLKEYNQRLEQSNRDLADFAYVASHDLQEPLRKIITFSDRLVKKFGDALDETGRDYLERMQSATRRMQLLIVDLLSISLISSKPQQIEAVNLSEIAKQVIADMDLVLEKNNGQIQLEELPCLPADSSQMYQLLQNLIGNALKFHAASDPVRVTVRSEADGPEHIRLLISDNGIGFDMREVERIFKPLQRLVGRSQYEGSGMGLAICRRIVERHNGQISAESEPGKGSTFIVRLPLRQQEVGLNF